MFEGDDMGTGVRFLQCGGCLFDSPSWEGPEEWAAQRNKDLWQSFEEALSLCREEKVELLFFTGNLFEQEYVQKQTVERIAKMLGNLKETKVFIAPGEKDPLVATSAYRLTIWPDNVHIFTSGISFVKVPVDNITVYGSGWAAYKQDRIFLDRFQADREETIPLMLLHGEVNPIRSTDGFRPILPEHIAASGLAYLALGHQQDWSGVQKAGATVWADSGYLEARNFAAKGSHGILRGEIGPSSTQLEFMDLGKRSYVEKTLVIQENYESLGAKILAETTSEERQRDLFRFKLTGFLPKADAALQYLKRLLTDKFRYAEVMYDEEEMNAQFEAGVRALLDETVGNKDGFQTLTSVFMAKLDERQIRAENSDNYKHWELVKKVCLSALEQGCIDDEN